MSLSTSRPLTTRDLNRALLDRQHLLERSTLALPEVIETMGGIQHQYAPAGYIGLWSRVHGFERPMLTRALEDRSVVQATLMRATIHTVSAADYWPMTAGIRRIRREWLVRVARRELERIDMEAAAIATRRLLAAGPLRMRELTDRLVELGFPPIAARWVGMWVDLVRVPPSGTWEQRRADLYGLAEEWVPGSGDIAEVEGMRHLVRRYLGAFGPAPLRDIASWMGVRVGQMRAAADSLELRTHRSDEGADLVDLPDATLPDPETPAPPRFLAVWDAALLVHARRTAILPEAYRPRVFNTRTPQSVNTFVLDGQVAGTWRYTDDEILLEPFREPSGRERAALEEEAHRLAALHR